MSSTERSSTLPKFDARFVPNIFVAAVLVYSAIFSAWGRARGTLLARRP